MTSQEIPNETKEYIAQRDTVFSTFILGPNDPGSEICRQIERDVFFEVFGNTEEEMKEEYGPYEAYSHFVLAYENKTGRPIGSVRMIFNSPAGLKSLNDLKKPEPWDADIPTILKLNGIEDLDRTVDHATTALYPEFRKSNDESSLAHMALQATFYTAALQMKMKYFVAIFDDGPLNDLNKMGMGIKTMKPLGSKPYLGSKGSTPIYGDMDQMIEKIQTESPWLYDILTNNVWLLGEDQDAISA